MCSIGHTEIYQHILVLSKVCSFSNLRFVNISSSCSFVKSVNGGEVVTTFVRGGGTLAFLPCASSLATGLIGTSPCYVTEVSTLKNSHLWVWGCHFYYYYYYFSFERSYWEFYLSLFEVTLLLWTLLPDA